MAETSPDEVRRIAALARLHVSEAEVERFAEQFERILGQFWGLAELDVEGVEPTIGAHRALDVRRPDEPRPGLEPDDVLAGAPRREGDFFAVPRAIADAPEREIQGGEA